CGRSGSAARSRRASPCRRKASAEPKPAFFCTICVEQGCHLSCGAMQSLDSAIAAQRELLRQNPKHLGGLNLIGAMLVQSGQFDEAARYLGEALQLNARSDATLNNYALALKALRRPLEAVRHFDQALAINPRAADTWASRGAALTDLARHA